MQAALAELRELITTRFPQARFTIEENADPDGYYLVATVDIDDSDEVVGLIGDRLLEMQVDEELPVYVTPLRPIERVFAQLQERMAVQSLTPPPLSEAENSKIQAVFE
jgi:hypothetical protein